MWWIALPVWLHESPSTPVDAAEWVSWAQTYTPRVTRIDEALVLEVQGSLRLFGGRQALQQVLAHEARARGVPLMAAGPTPLAAVGLLRHTRATRPPDSTDLPTFVAVEPHEWPQCLHTWSVACLSAAQAHQGLLHRLGCRSMGDLLAMPRGGLTRRCGAPLLQALDQLTGQAPWTGAWFAPSDRFKVSVALPGPTDSADRLMFGARRLLQQLSLWLDLRKAGILSLQLEWTYDPRRCLRAPCEALEWTSHQPSRDWRHWTHVVSSLLQHTTLEAPVVRLQLEALSWAPLPESSGSLLPDAMPTGAIGWGVLLDRLSARLGDKHLWIGQLQATQRPAQQQSWQSPLQAQGQTDAPLAPDAGWQPGWRVRNTPSSPPQNAPSPLGAHSPCSQRIESHWWCGAAEANGAERTDYRVADLAGVGLVLLARDRAEPNADWVICGHYG